MWHQGEMSGLDRNKLPPLPGAAAILCMSHNTEKSTNLHLHQWESRKLLVVCEPQRNSSSTHLSIFFHYWLPNPWIFSGQKYKAMGKITKLNYFYITLWKDFLLISTFLVQRRCDQSRDCVYISDENTHERHLKGNKVVIGDTGSIALWYLQVSLLYLLLIKVNERGSSELLVGVAQQSVRTTLSLLSALWIPTSIKTSSLAETLKFFGIGEFPINNCISVLKCPDPCKSSKMV